MTIKNKLSHISKSAKTLSAALIIATIGVTSLAAPASAAGGSLSISIYAGNNSEEAQAIRTGMQLYSIFNAVQNGAVMSQSGLNNMAGIDQNGVGNQAIVHQEGVGHSGTIRQNGNNNAYGLFQFGRNTNAQVNQYGNNNTGLTFLFGH